jgi:hypothetical protein
MIAVDRNESSIDLEEGIMMQHPSFRFLIALVTFVAGTITASIWWHLRSQSSVDVADASKQERQYIPGTHYDAARGALQKFSSSDGMNFKKWTIPCGSPERARKEMQEILKKATQIVSREATFNAQGIQVGENVVAVFPSNDEENGAASSLHVGESEYLIQVTSTSLENILAYKRDFGRLVKW